MTLASALRTNMRSRRKALGLSQVSLAHKAGYCARYIRQVERGAKGNPTLFFVENIAGALGCAPEDLLQPGEA